MARVVVDFNHLPRTTRERLVESTGPKPRLEPIMAAPSSKAMPLVGWSLLGLGGLYILQTLLPWGFGTLGFYIDAVQSPGFILPYGIAFFCLAAAIFGIVFQLKLRKALPFRPGRYLFPLDIVDARSQRLVIRSLSDATDIQAVHHHKNGVYTHTVFTFVFPQGQTEEFSVRSQRDAEVQFRQFQRIRAEFGNALKTQDVDTIHRYDLFFDVRVQGGFEALQGSPSPSPQGGVLAGGMPRLLEKRWLAVLLLAGVLGPGTWLIRNLASDHLAFAAAKEQANEESFRNYLRAGWLHVDEAKELGEKHAYTECEQRETEQCWLSFLDNWSESPRLQEARTERLPRAALKEASHAVSSLRQFRKKYPHSVVDADAQAKIHELFTQALADFQQEASTKNPALVPFVSKLLAHLEATENPMVLVRFRREVSGSLAKADKLLAKMGAEDGRPMAQVSPFFADARTLPLENTIATELGVAFKQIFPTDLLALEKGATFAKEEGSPRESVPALDIVYTVGWSGASYGSEKDRRLFVGIEFGFDVNMRVPDEKPLHFTLSVTPPQRFSVEYTGRRSSLGVIDPDSGPTDESVYRIMALRAFDELDVKLRQTFFRPDSKAFKAYLPTAFGTLP